MADYSTDIGFNCPECGNLVEITVPVSPPNWGEDKAIDRMVQEEIDLACPHCDAFLEVDVINRDNQVEMTFRGYPGVVITCSQGSDRAPDPDDYWNDIPDGPDGIFKDSLADALRLLDQHGHDWQPSTVNRMVFVHAFGALEAYLGDTLLNYINANDDALIRTLEQDKDLKSEKLTLVEVLTDEDVVFKRVALHLKAILYHNLAKVQALYRIAARIDIFPDEAIKDRLFTALPLRHDCVHRNGTDKDGASRDEVTRGYVRQFASDITALVNHIEGEIAAQQN